MDTIEEHEDREEAELKPATPERRRQAPPPSFIPKLRGQKVTIKLSAGGQPIAGTLEGYNSYELLVQTSKGKIIIFKGAVATIEEGPKGIRP
jgi:sRNA-binding regulator protein Hfq